MTLFVCTINLKLHLSLCTVWWFQVWDVISNKEAVEIVACTLNREKAAKTLVNCAVRAWKYKRRGIAMDDISAICLFFHSPPSPLGEASDDLPEEL